MKNSDKTDGEDKRVVEEVKEEKVESEVQPTPVNKKEKEKKVVKINKSGLNWYGVGVTILFVLPLIVTGIIYVRHCFIIFLLLKIVVTQFFEKHKYLGN